ncbi:SixA phosphatase family protein [Blastochloris viridis]|uniref:Acid phosphatase n=1 Tax=Blastochloris viridis TaxID=1079 RepID=A0A0H5BA71_BLAVI|nr:histidine phosphatase family protein [Blastochloris viridis]ALK08774.1 Histidine phosphatase superfamily (branch 1) [Blastochloris viridis]BAR97929.1 phosphohistidine phosphatase SixA [Blastochloris viridis]CUU41435.1 acid phosphatase [Blastochloris viridis]
MRRLMLLRHTKSDWSQTTADRGRPLNDRGRVAAPLMGAYLAHHALVPDRAVVSPARRTLETWELASKPLAGLIEPVVDERIYEASADSLLCVVRDQPEHCHLLLLVGHNPGLQDLALRMIATGDAEARRRLAEKYPTGGLTVIDFAVDDWSVVHPRSGRLDRFVVPKMLDAPAD